MRQSAHLLALVRYYSDNIDIVIVSGLWCVFICKYAEYVAMWGASFLKPNNVEARRCPAEDSVCVNIFRQILYLYTENARGDIRSHARVLFWKHGFFYLWPSRITREGNAKARLPVRARNCHSVLV